MRTDTSTEMDAACYHHELMPFIERLKHMIARPDKLLAAIGGTDAWTTASATTPVADEYRLVLRTKAASFQRAQLRDVAHAWPSIVAAVSRSTRLSLHSQRIDCWMQKLALWHIRLWNSLVAVCVDAVVRMHAVLFHASQHAPALFAPLLEAQSRDAVSQRIVRRANATLSKRSRLARQSNEFMLGWFIAHKSNPYPTADERAQIAVKTSLTEQQVRNWFANMRKRHWKPNRSSSSSSAKKPRCLIDVVLRQHDA